MRRGMMVALVCCLAAGAALASTLALATRADPATPDPKAAVATPPAPTFEAASAEAASALSALADARVDLARRLLGTTTADDIRGVSLVDLRHAAWDGCLGIIRHDALCTQQLVGGLVAIFDVAGATYRYHIAGAHVIATDFLEPPFTLSDPPPPDPHLQADDLALLAEYVRADSALSTTLSGEVIVLGIVPAEFTNSCFGELRPEKPECAEPQDDVSGGLVSLQQPDGRYELYGVTHAGVYRYDLAHDIPRPYPDPAITELQRRMRENLANRLGIGIETIAIASYREVTWPDGCIGVRRPDRVCTAALTPGFVARLTAPGADDVRAVYQYHGADGAFTAVSFLSGVTLELP